MTTRSRVSLSMNPDQLKWLHVVFATLQRGGDVGVMMRHKDASAVRVLQLASNRGEMLEAKPQRTHCKHGHEYTAENARYFDRHGIKVRFCRRCRSELARRSMVKKYAEAKAAREQPTEQPVA